MIPFQLSIAFFSVLYFFVLGSFPVLIQILFWISLFFALGTYIVQGLFNRELELKPSNESKTAFYEKLSQDSMAKSWRHLHLSVLVLSPLVVVADITLMYCLTTVACFLVPYNNYKYIGTTYYEELDGITLTTETEDDDDEE